MVKFINSSIDEEAPAKEGVRKKKQKRDMNKDLDEDDTAPVISDPSTASNNDIIADSGESPNDVTSEGDSQDSDDESSSSTDVDEFTFDLATPAEAEEVVHGWGEVARDGHVPHSEDTSHRLAVCNMDWDRLSANDIFGE